MPHSAPPPPRGTVVPERAREVLDRHAPVTILRAPAGYGKSAVVSRWIRDGGAAGRVWWIGAAEGDVLKQLAEVAGAEAATARGVARALAAETPVTVVVDDLDEAPPAADAALLALVGRVPGLHLVVMARARRPLEIRARMAGDPAVVTAAELTLDPATVRAMLEERGLTARPAEADQVLEEAQGWPAVIRAALSHARNEGGRLVVDWPAVDEVVTELLQLDDRLLRVLTPLTTLPDLDLTGVGAAIGVTRAEAAEIVAEIDGLGLVDAGGPGTPARLGPALHRRLTRMSDPGDPGLRAAHRRLAELDRDRRLPIRAITHALDGGAWVLAMTLFDDNLLTILLNQADLVARLLSEVPAAVLAEHPVAIAAAQLIHPGSGAAPPAPVADPRFETLAKLAVLARARFSGQLDEAARIAREIAASLAPVAEPARSSGEASAVRVQIATCLFLVGDLDGAVRECDLALAPADPPALAVHAALGGKALIAALRGNLTQVRELLDRADAVPAGSGGMWQRTLVWAQCARAVAAVGSLDVPAAQAGVAALADVPVDEELWAVIAFTRGLVMTFTDPYRGLRDLRRARVAEERRCPPGSLAADLLRGVELTLLHAAGEGTRAARLLRTEEVGRSLDGLTDGRAARVLLALGLEEEARRRAAFWHRAPAAMPWSRSVSAAVAAVAAHRLGRAEEAARALADVVVRAEEHGLLFPLVTVPWVELSAIADAAGDAAARALLDSPRVRALRDVYPARLEQIDLTDRELVVLGELAREGSQERIAAELFVSTNTVKSQLQSLYRKLGASSRDEALTVAAQVGLLGD